MGLPSYSNGFKWKNYKNITPTFDLTSVEKPDMSPFLIHMTGKGSLIDILEGNNSPAKEKDRLPSEHGFLKAAIPVYNKVESNFNSKVVCFTESPIFALDFFRYRSFKRWKDDQQFGIGFSKSYLVEKKKVKPVIYLDDESNHVLLNFCNQVINNNYEIKELSGSLVDMVSFCKQIRPLLFPLLEKERLQGFMWEREWRCGKGMYFHHRRIKVICCPVNEKQTIIGILGKYSNNIQIVESWKEYDEVTDYLKRRQSKTNVTKVPQIVDMEELLNLKIQIENTIQTLRSHREVFKHVVDSLEKHDLDTIIGEMKSKLDTIDNRIAEVEEEEKEKIDK